MVLVPLLSGAFTPAAGGVEAFGNVTVHLTKHLRYANIRRL